MTGAEFLNKIQGIKEITNIHWEIKGKDSYDPDEVKVVIVADNEEFSVIYPNPYINEEGSFNQFVALALIINKLMKQLNNDFTVCAGDDLAGAVNYARKQLNG